MIGWFLSYPKLKKITRQPIQLIGIRSQINQTLYVSRITDTGDHMITSIPVPRSQILGRLILPKSTSTSTFDSNDLSGDLCIRENVQNIEFTRDEKCKLFL